MLKGVKLKKKSELNLSSPFFLFFIIYFQEACYEALIPF